MSLLFGLQAVLGRSEQEDVWLCRENEAARANDEKRMSTDFMMTGNVSMKSSCHLNIFFVNGTSPADTRY
jgi:hypothetical protein